MSEERKAAERLAVKGIGAILLIAFLCWAVPQIWDKLSPFIIAIPLASALTRESPQPAAEKAEAASIKAIEAKAIFALFLLKRSIPPPFVNKIISVDAEYFRS